MKSEPHLTVEHAVQVFYNRHDFGEDGGINNKIAWIKFGFFSIPIPNVQSRRKNVYLHDANHIITGYDTSWKGESAVAAWEIATGGWRKLGIPWLLTLSAMGIGVLVYPQQVLLSFKQGLSMKNSLTCGLTKNEIFRLSVTELRKFVSNHPKSNKNAFLWMIISLLVLISPWVILLVSIWGIAKLF